MKKTLTESLNNQKSMTGKNSRDKRVLNNVELVYVGNTIKNPTREPRTYTVDICGRVYYMTREHLKPRSNNMPREVNEHLSKVYSHSLLHHQPTSVSPAKISIDVKAETPVS